MESEKVMDWAASRAEHKPASGLRRGRDTMEFIVKMVFLLCGFVAVSYTHLDVYKRQGSWS